MKKHIRIIKVLGIVLLTLLIIVGGVSIYRVNKKYPSKTLNKYNIGESFEYESYEFCIKDAEIYKYWDFKEKFDYTDTCGMEPLVEENDTHILLVYLKIKNVSSDTLEMPPVMYFTLQSIPGAISYNFNYSVLNELYDNDLSLLSKELSSGETVEVILPFSLDATYISFYDGSMLYENDFQFVVSLYPEKNYVIFE